MAQSLGTNFRNRVSANPGGGAHTTKPVTALLWQHLIIVERKNLVRRDNSVCT